LRAALGVLILVALAGGRPVAAAGRDQRPDLWPNELSALARLPDGTFLLADDETRDQIFVWSGDPGRAPRPRALGLRLDDLEGAAADSHGTVYLLTSHSLTRRGRSRPDRARLARLRRGAELEAIDDLRPALVRLLGAGGSTDGSAPPGAGDLNLEGLAWYPAGERLLIGARSPITGGRAQVIELGPAPALFDPPRAAGDLSALDPVVHRLDLGGRGVRSLEYDPWRNAVLVLAGPAGAGARGYALFVWTPGDDDRVVPLQAPALGDLRQPEAVAPAGPPDPVTGEAPLIVAGEGGPPVEIRARPAPP
jgi:hypothetical protein